MSQALRRYLPPLVGIVLFLAALWVVINELSGERFYQLTAELAGIPSSTIVIAILLTALSYLVLSGYDALALHFIRKPLPLRRTLLTSFVAYAFSHSIGFAVLSGGGVRYRLYSTWGLSAAEVAVVTGFSALTLIVGITAIVGVAALLQPEMVGLMFRIPPEAAALVGGVLALLTVAYVALGGMLRRSVRIAGVDIRLPGPRLAAGQVGVSALDWAIASGTLYVLLPAEALPSFAGFVVVFTVAAGAGLISNVPGGLGVIEGVMLLALPGEAPTAILAALVVWRAVYYLLPLVVAALMLGVYELLARRHLMDDALGRVAGGWHGIAPSVFALTVFVTGAVIMLSTALPAAGPRLVLLDPILPLAVVELAHFLSSLAGMALMVAAWGLRRRLDAAFVATLCLLGLATLLALLKGLRVELAAFTLLLLVLLSPGRPAFYRRGSLARHPVAMPWLLAIAMTVATVVVAGLFVYGNVEYSEELWFRVALRADAPRFLRAIAAAFVILLAVGLWHLLGVRRFRPAWPTVDNLARLRPILREHGTVLANLALTGDKRLLFGDGGRSVVIHAVEGRSWVALGDPVGPTAERLEMAWTFRETAEASGAWPVFYQVPEASLPVYAETGFTLQKLGEQALVPLNGPAPEGELLRSRNEQARTGLSFEVLGPAASPAVMHVLRRVFEEWWDNRGLQHKGFSLPRFDPDYLHHFDIAVVRRAGEIVAFGNLWPSAGRDSLGIEQIRYRATVGRRVLDFLLVELMRHARALGFARLDLGMAPAVGEESAPLTPLLDRAGPLLFRHGEHFDDAMELRSYKESFEPVWEPRYLASPGGIVLPRVLADVGSLIVGRGQGALAMGRGGGISSGVAE